jgi:hypothetical protein
MGKTPLFKVLTDTEYVCPSIGLLNHAHHYNYNLQSQLKKLGKLITT